ncbi:hypothetical protein LOTGIDRAFT_163820 [Lottia gigantea]|uniref:OTU domain-containing protein n=1 Tax=Lottia gigantea TaxID=225164 RepID=V4BNY1_LOTGI|nr:hypothetical protein LOTGIDRAFT_163820 [Lottia gigantea]ESO90624.1 hypothetical protein LOTGIDRAFT_163820 [Lottia gigantea]
MRLNSSLVFDSPFVEHFNHEPWATSPIRRGRHPAFSRVPRPGMDHIADTQRRVLDHFHREVGGDFGFRRLNEESSSARGRNGGFDDSRARIIPIQVIREPRREFCEIQRRPSPCPRYIDVSDDSDCDEPKYIGPNDNNNGLRNLQPVGRSPPKRITNQGRVDSHTERSRPVSDRLPLTVLQTNDSLTRNVQPSASRPISQSGAARQHSTSQTASTKALGDGNCFFRALSKEVYGLEEFHAEVRQAVMDVIEKYPKKFEQFLDDDSSMKEHIKDMRLLSTWSTTMEIYGAATLLQRDIYVLSPNHTGESYSWLLFSPRFAYNGEMKYHPCYITLCHTNGNHYDRIAATHHECNCNLNAPKLTGAECYVDLTNAELSVY